MSVLNDTKIWEMICAGMIDFTKSDTDPETVRAQVNPNTLDLTLGRYARLPLDCDQPIIFGKKHHSELFWELREISEAGILLRPGDVFLGSSREYIVMPKNVCGQVYTKSSLGRVFINHMMAGVIDAGFAGTITLEFKNEGKHDILLPFGARVVQLQFSLLNDNPERDYSMRVSRYQGQTLPEPAREERRAAD